MIDILVIPIRVEYFLFGDRHIREMRLPRHSLMALVMNGAAVHSMCCLIIAFIPAVKYNKDIGSMPLLLCGGRMLHDGLSMTEVYTNCTALFIVHRRTPARCKYHFDLRTDWM